MPGKTERSLISRPGFEGLALEALPGHSPDPDSGGNAPYGAIDETIVVEGTEHRAQHVTNGHRPTAIRSQGAGCPLASAHKKGARWAPGKGCGDPGDQLPASRQFSGSC
jgi:hypothetical protein